MPPLFGQAREVARQIIAADHVYEDIDAAAVRCAVDLLDEILGLVVDRQCRAELKRPSAFLIASASDNDFDPEQLTKGDCHGSDPASAAMDQDPIAVGSEAALEQIHPHGE